MFEKIYIYEDDTQSYNLCDWCGEHNYCSEVTGKIRQKIKDNQPKLKSNYEVVEL